jgi:hypothetical protein
MNEIEKTDQNNSIPITDEKQLYEQRIKSLEQKVKKSKRKNAENTLMQKVNALINRRAFSFITIAGLFLALLSYIGYTTLIDVIIKHIVTDKLQEQVLYSAKSEILIENKRVLDSLKTNINRVQDSLKTKINNIAEDMSQSSEFFVKQLGNLNPLTIGGWIYYGQRMKLKRGLENRISNLRFVVVGRSSKYTGKREPTYVYMNDTLRVLSNTNVRLGPRTESGSRPAIGQLKKDDRICVLDIQTAYDAKKNLEVWIQVAPIINGQR